MTMDTVDLEGRLLPGLVAVALFVVLSAVYATAELPGATGFPGEGSITASIGYAMFNLGDLASHPSEQFLIAFEIIDIVLVAALVGSIMLARREEDGELVTALTDGGREIRDRLRGEDGGED
jgi:NADH-quinone oxidoreductase subunit J